MHRVMDFGLPPHLCEVVHFAHELPPLLCTFALLLMKKPFNICRCGGQERLIMSGRSRIFGMGVQITAIARVVTSCQAKVVEAL